MPAPSSEFFPEIGKVVEAVAKTDDVQPADATFADDDENPTHVLQSLCMNCHKQVRIPLH